MSNASFYDFHCPAGGKWYACPSTSASKFVGCCTSDPCSNGCVQGDLKPGAFNASHHGEFPDASCGAASTFWTCKAGATFWGCCKSNACANSPPSCSAGDLVPAYLSLPNQITVYTSSSPSSTPQPKSSNNTAAIAGAVVGGVVVLAIIGALLFWWRKKKQYQKPANDDPGAMGMLSPKKGGDRFSSQYGNQSPPPTYSSPETDYYQTMSPSKLSYQHQYTNIAAAPQELPAELPSSNGPRYSELPAGSTNPHRYSELPAGAGRASELESPQPSPRPMQTEFSADLAKQNAQNSGLGVVIENSQSSKSRV